MTRQSWKAGGEGNGSKRLSEKWLTLTALGEGSVDEVTFFLNWMPPFVQLYAKHLRLQPWDNTLLPFYSLFLVVVAAPFFLRNVACSPFTCAIDWFSKRRPFGFLHFFFFLGLLTETINIYLAARMDWGCQLLFFFVLRFQIEERLHEPAKRHLRNWKQWKRVF